ncbi:hypothetical protein HRI_000129700 [Hibiscus trionum]|uniref:Tf2-1-like SH3-like domain-containing protein n=1 Tax=Hibiscus trionum TaxID=183268 RepID=A0A9W7GTE6_HIBTR|nr:hypothetical protein HRI_000129700 [Hibiscus trionum]
MVSYEALYGRKCRTPFCWAEAGQKLVSLPSVLKGTTEKVSPWKKVMRFCWKGKLSPIFIEPYEVLERVGHVAYRLRLPSKLEKIHDVFHISMLRKYRSDPSPVMHVEEIELNPYLSYEEEPIEILDSDNKFLCGKTIDLVKDLWRDRGVEEATWERKTGMKA